jgi:hypothetical protein
MPPKLAPVPKKARAPKGTPKDPAAPKKARAPKGAPKDPAAPTKARAPKGAPKDPAAQKKARAPRPPKYSFEELNTRITEVNHSISLMVNRRGTINDQLNQLRAEKRSLLQKLKRFTEKTEDRDDWYDTQSKDTEVTFLQVPKPYTRRAEPLGRAQTAAGTAGRPQPALKRTS